MIVIARSEACLPQAGDEAISLYNLQLISYLFFSLIHASTPVTLQIYSHILISNLFKLINHFIFDSVFKEFLQILFLNLDSCNVIVMSDSQLPESKFFKKIFSPVNHHKFLSCNGCPVWKS